MLPSVRPGKNKVFDWTERQFLRGTSKPLLQFFQGLYEGSIASPIRRLGIAKKFGYSYALAIGIAVVGTGVGMVTGEYYETRSLQQLAVADRQQQLLADLKEAVLEMRSHPQRLLPVLGKQIGFQYESGRFLGSVDRMQRQQSALKIFINRHPNDLAGDRESIQQFLQAYKAATEAYTQRIQRLWEQTDPASLTAAEIPAVQQQLLQFMSGSQESRLDNQFEYLSEDLARLIDAAESQKQQANVVLQRARRVRIYGIVASMVLSAAIATAMALYTSRAIARPLEVTNKVARQVTQDSNFDLRIPVTTEDEVGSLAISLNQLIQQVGSYTHELEAARDTLEQRIEARTRELQQTQLQLIQTEKMSSLGQLVAGVAHEINNPTNFIHGNLKYTHDYVNDLLGLVQLYQQEYPQATATIQAHIATIDLEFIVQDMPKLLASMEMGTERIQEIVRSLRTFSRLDEAETKAVDVHVGIESTLVILNHRLKMGIKIVKQYDDLPLVECYPAQLNQVFMNLLTNAIDALESSAVWDTETVAESDLSHGEHKPTIKICTAVTAANQVKISIADNGPGIPLEIQNKLFDPFFTTKEAGKGTGMGLSICYQIVQKHQGKIDVYSEPGQGTEFAIALPIQANPASPG